MQRRAGDVRSNDAAGSWIYIGSSRAGEHTKTFVEAGRQHYNGTLAGRWVLTAGLGGMGGAQPPQPRRWPGVIR